ncbi:hypothetical protein SRHO_G00272340 [Serrasalmus rhombeus]
MTPLQVPLHQIHLASKLVSDDVVVGVRQSLPVPGVSFILGNDLAGGKVWGNTEVVPPPIVVSVPKHSNKADQCFQKHPHVFSACAVTRAMAKHGDLSVNSLSLEDTFLATPEGIDCSPSRSSVGDMQSDDPGSPSDSSDCLEVVAKLDVVQPVEVGSNTFPATSVCADEIDRPISELFKVSREELIKEQGTDSTLQPLFALAEAEDKIGGGVAGYFMQGGLLCRQWVFRCEAFTNTVLQVVVPCKFRKAVLELAHNGVAGHTGVRKTYDRVMRRYRLYEARAAARRRLGKVQSRMQTLFNRKAEHHKFQPGDLVLALLPLLNSPFQAKFMAPYKVVKCLPDHNYLLNTPDRRKKGQVCHINLLKPYFPSVGLPRTVPDEGSSESVAVSTVFKDCCLGSVSEELDEGVSGPPQEIVVGRLRNSEILADLSPHLSHLSTEERNDLVSLIHSFPSLFPDIPTRTSLVEHDIDVAGALPIRQHAYRVNPMKRELLCREVDYLIANNLAEPSFSAWSSPCLLVDKPDGTYHFCTDYRKLNSVTKPDCFPLPRCGDCVDRVGSATFVSKFDLLKGYWQVPLTARAKELSAFITPDNFLQYQVMPFGVRNAPSTFQRLVNCVLAGMYGCDAYLDDLVIYSATWRDHINQIKELFARLSAANLTINLAKCEFGKARVTYLGKVVGGGQVRPVEAKVEAI